MKNIYKIKLHSSQHGFTIVELLVVIVVIGILAAITIVSYTGITQRATATTLSSDLSSASQQLKLYQVLYGSYPTSLDSNNCPTAPNIDNNYCLKPTSGNTFLYSANNNSTPQTFSLYDVNNSTKVKYHTTNDSAPSISPQVVATGGTITNIDGYRIHTFTASGSFTVTSGGDVEVLVVAGGGGGGMDMGGGGGGGGVIHNLSYPVTLQAYPITVGAGGNGAPAAGTNGQPTAHQYTISATSGQNSSFGSLSAFGGGFGGSSYYAYTPNHGLGGVGGSGGGTSGYSDTTIKAGALGTTGQGNSGGQGGGQYYSGGGGGAGSAGSDSPNQPNGGVGYLSDINGTSLYWGGGGGGASYSLAIGGNGGNGGGGGGAIGATTGGTGLNPGAPGGGGAPNSGANTPGGNGGTNTGGGGGGGSHYNANNNGGNGGSGIVIIRYPN